MKENILALPSKDRFRDESLALLARAGIPVEIPGRQLSAVMNLPKIGQFTVALMRPRDIVERVALGQISLGIAGFDSVEEYLLKDKYSKPQDQTRPVEIPPVQTLLKLGIGRCRMVVMASLKSGIQSIPPKGERIATSYPWIGKEFLDPNGELEFRWVELSGSVEVAPAIGLADAVLDIVEEGKTRDENKLREIFTLFDSEGLLITNGLNKKGSSRFADAVKDRISAVL